jgi:ABC-type sulfate transport system substrate-binding protein
VSNTNPATREFYADYNRMFAAVWRRRGGGVEVVQTPGGSGAQADAVIAGEPADVVTLAPAAAVDRVASAGLLDAERHIPLRGCPTTVVFLVRKGKPTRIADGGNLLGDVWVATANPKTSGVARQGYLAASTCAPRPRTERRRGSDARVAVDCDHPHTRREPDLRRPTTQKTRARRVFDVPAMVAGEGIEPPTRGFSIPRYSR